MMWTEEEYADYLARQGKAPGKTPEKRRSKYNARKTWVDGICFDSAKEAGYYSSLKLLHRCGELDGFLYHGKMVVAEGKDMEQRAALYEPDFVLLYPDGHYEVVDVKGMETREFKLKIKVLRERYPRVTIRAE